MKGKRLEQIKEDYLATPIPEELDLLVKDVLKESGVKMYDEKKIFRGLKVAAASLVASLLLLTAGVNTSAAFAQTMLKVPLVGNIVEVVTFREYTFDQNTFNAKIKTPAISGLGDKELEDSLNQKYLAENEGLYLQFLREIEDMEELGGGHLGVDSGYIVKTDNERILAIGRYVVNIVGSSSTVFKYDTIDKEKEILLTLPSLFKDDSYVRLISENIKKQMLEQHRADENNIYWLPEIQDDDVYVEFFEEIEARQSFYINPANKLVISFDKYEVAPGYMGVVEFEIPTEAIADILVGQEYIN